MPPAPPRSDPRAAVGPPARPPLRVLGIDPGTRIAGWAVVEAQGPRYRAIAYGALRADARKDRSVRLAALAAGLTEIVETHAPGEAAIEEAFHGRDARAALAIGEARGAFSVVLAVAGLPPTSYANNVVKKSVTGAGRAGKAQVQAAVRRILGLDELPTPFDAADALAVALCHLQRRSDPGLGKTGPGASRPGGVPAHLAEALKKQGIDPRRLRGRRR